MKKILYIDMDNVLVNFKSALPKLDQSILAAYENRLYEVPGIFSLMDPIEGAIESYTELSKLFDTYILSAAPWVNESAWSDKLLWVKKYLGKYAENRLIISQHKQLCHGDFIIDDRLTNGVDKFIGEHIHFGTEKFPEWKSVMMYLKVKA